MDLVRPDEHKIRAHLLDCSATRQARMILRQFADGGELDG